MNVSDNSKKTDIILIVEDEALVRMIAAETLREDGGFKVVDVVDADEALTVLEATSDIRVLVTDVDMPGSLDGFTLARVVKQAWPDIGIVVTSGRVAPGPKDLPSGALFISKPYMPADLIAAVRRVLPSSPIERLAQEPVPVLPSAIKISPPHTGIGISGCLAQPLPEPEE